jgi:hypothetical protein
MKGLEGEILEKLAELGFEALELERETVDPHQFLGLELNPRAAAIAAIMPISRITTACGLRTCAACIYRI